MQRVAATKITIFPEAATPSSTFRARLDLPPGAIDLAPGMYVKVGLVIGEAERILVPLSSVVERSEVSAVYVIDPRGRVSLRYVRPGHRLGDKIEILSGLAVRRTHRARSHRRGRAHRRAGTAAVSRPLGISGRLARAFLDNQLTPLLALTALLMGVFAVLVTPREEEPQIDVTFANILIPFPGASSEQVENLVATPMEKVLGEISGVKHIYSVSRPGLAVMTVQYASRHPSQRRHRAALQRRVFESGLAARGSRHLAAPDQAEGHR